MALLDLHLHTKELAQIWYMGLIPYSLFQLDKAIKSLSLQSEAITSRSMRNLVAHFNGTT